MVIKDTLQKQLDNIKNKISSSSSNTSVPINTQFDTSAINKEINNLSVMIHKLGENISLMTSRLNENISSAVSKTSSKIKTEAQQISDETRKSFGEFEVSNDPTERLKQHLTNTEEKIVALQRRWQELNAALEQTKGDDAAGEQIGTQINNIEHQLLSLQSQYERTQAAIRESTVQTSEQVRESVTAAVNEAFQSFSTAENSVDRLQQKLQLNQTALKNLEGELSRTQQLLSVTDDSLEQERLVAKINRIKAQMLSLTEASERISSQISASAAAAAENVRQQSASAAAQTAEGFTAAANPVERLKQKLELIKNSMAALEQEIRQLQGLLAVTDDALEQEKIIAKIEKIKAKMLSLAESADRVSTEITAANANSKTFGKRLLSVLSLPIKGFKLLGKSALRSLNPVKFVMDSTQKTAKKFSTGVQRALRSAFLMVGVYAAIRGFKSVLSDAVNSSDEFKKSLNEIKANLKIAFVPIMNAVMPAINTLMSGLAKVTKGIATFTSELFGSTYAQSLETAKKAQEASKKVNDTGKKISKEVKKNSTYLAAFDEMNVVQDTSENSESDSDDNNTDDNSQDDKTGIDYSVISGEGVKLPDWAEKLKQAIKKGDWKGVGRTLANAVNGAFENLDFGKAAQNLSNGIKNSLDTATEFILTIDWKMIGSKIADFINNIDFEGIFSRFGAFLSTKFKAILDLLIGLIENIKWKELTQKLMAAIGGFLENIDWIGLLKRAAELLGAAFGAAATILATVGKALWEALKKAFEGTKDYFNKYIDEAGGNVILGLWNGIIDALKNAYQWIKEHIFKPFMDGFRKTFDIHSPSKVMAEQGILIIQGMINGIASKISQVKEKFKEILTFIQKVFKDLPEWFKNKFLQAWRNIKSVFGKVGEFFGGIWDTIKSKFSSIGTSVGDAIGGAFKKAINGVLETVEKTINFIPDKVNPTLQTITDWTGISLPYMPTVELPRLASGGLAKAPTLAMVGDNRNASVDPEVIAPLSKLESMLSGGAEMSEIVEILREIIHILNNLDLRFVAEVEKRTLFDVMRKLASEYKRQTGVNAF